MSILIVTEKQKNFLLENINSKQKAEDLLTSHIKKTYPFITKIQLKKPNNIPTIVDANIDIDLSSPNSLTSNYAYNNSALYDNDIPLDTQLKSIDDLLFKFE